MNKSATSSRLCRARYWVAQQLGRSEMWTGAPTMRLVWCSYTNREIVMRYLAPSLPADKCFGPG